MYCLLPVSTAPLAAFDSLSLLFVGISHRCIHTSVTPSHPFIVERSCASQTNCFVHRENGQKVSATELVSVHEGVSM